MLSEPTELCTTDWQDQVSINISLYWYTYAAQLPLDNKKGH